MTDYHTWLRLDRISQSVRTAEAFARQHVQQFLQWRGANGCGSAISASHPIE